MIAAVAAALAALAAAAEPPPPPATPAGILSFADALLRSGESYRAATEYQRYLHHFPDGPGANRAVEGLGRAYATAGRWDAAAAAFRDLVGRRPGDGGPRLLLGTALYRAGRYGEAAAVLFGDDPSGEAAVLGTLALLRQSPEPDLPPAGRADLAGAFRALPRKSPAVAGTLAILPGAGHLYVGRPRDAAVAFVLNGAFLWGTVAAVRNEQWAVAGVLGLFELGWYSGNIASAINAAHKWNRREEGRFFRRWEEAAAPRWDLVVLPGGGGAQVSWRW